MRLWLRSSSIQVMGPDAVHGDARSHPAKLALLHGGEGGLGQGDHYVDLVARLLLGDPPAARVLDGDGALHREPKVGVGIGDEVLGLDQLEQVLRKRC